MLQAKSNEADLNIWQAKNIIRFTYLKPEVVVMPREYLFFIRQVKGVCVFKTEYGKEVCLQDTEIARRLIRMF